ncbi:hypothetical protein [Amycolatopsis minnesotensis]|uniref:DUF697 domain-containing protein n=1 Tax=Amycolatopsis minnesotensis TaxID=337894 RepID=A0ABP5CLM7_9PSEU
MPQDAIQLSTAAVVRAGRALRDALDDPERRALAATRLAFAGERGIGVFDETTAQAFASTGVPDRAAPQAELTVDVLAAALGQIDVANTLLAASTAVGEQGAPNRTALDQPLRRAGRTVELLADLNTPPVHHFRAEPPTSSTVDDAMHILRAKVTTTFDAIVTRSSEVVAASITGIRDGGPGALADGWRWAKQNLKLDEIGGKLAKLGLRALRGALRILYRLLPSDRLEAIQERVERLVTTAEAGSPALALLGAALGADETARTAASALDARPADAGRLDDATSALTALGARHGKVMDLCGGIATAIGFATTLTGLAGLGAPGVHVIVLGAHLGLLGAVVVIGREYVGRTGETISEATR